MPIAATAGFIHILGDRRVEPAISADGGRHSRRSVTPNVDPGRGQVCRESGAPTASVPTLSPSERVMPRFMLGRVTAIAAALGAIVNLLLGTDPHLNMDSQAFEAIARSLLAGHGFV